MNISCQPSGTAGWRSWSPHPITAGPSNNAWLTAGIDVTAALERGSYMVLDASEAMRRFMVSGWPDPFVAARARRAGLPPRRAGDLVTAVSELAANTLAHTSGPGSLALWVTGSEVICQVHDLGEITDPLAGKLRPDPVADGGARGLWVVHELCDLVEIGTGSAHPTIRVHMQLSVPDGHYDGPGRGVRPPA